MVTKLKPVTLTLSSLVEEYIESNIQLSENTVKSYRICLSNLLWYAQQNHWPKAARDITRSHIQEFLAYVSRERNRWGYTDPSRSLACPASQGTVHRYGRVIKRMFRWACDEEECLQENPTRRLRLGSPHPKEIEPYSDEEVYRMLGLCDDEARWHCRYNGIRNKAIISLFVSTGLRLEELSSLCLSDFDPTLRQVQVLGKGEKYRTVPIDGEAREALKHYLRYREEGGDELWKTEYGEVMSKHSIRIMVVRLRERAGIKDGGSHRFRHYFATKFLEVGGDLNSLRLLLGHSTLDMVLRYSRFIDIERAMTEHRQFNPLDRLVRGGRNRLVRRGTKGWRY